MDNQNIKKSLNNLSFLVTKYCLDLNKIFLHEYYLTDFLVHQAEHSPITSLFLEN
jgi:hypothetical protein